MVHIEVAADAIVVEGDLLEEACEEFAEALDSLRRSTATRATVDLFGTTAAASKAIGLLFALWLDTFSHGRALHLLAPGYVWAMLGKAAVEHMLTGKPGRGVQIGRT